MRKKLILPYAILSFIKFFTAKVSHLGDPTVQLVLKIYPTILNHFNMTGEETIENINKYKGTWYYEGRYMTIIGDEHGFYGEGLYSALIYLWWIATIIGAILLLYKLYKGRTDKV